MGFVEVSGMRVFLAGGCVIFDTYGGYTVLSTGYRHSMASCSYQSVYNGTIVYLHPLANQLFTAILALGVYTLCTGPEHPYYTCILLIPIDLYVKP